MEQSLRCLESLTKNSNLGLLKHEYNRFLPFECTFKNKEQIYEHR